MKRLCGIAALGLFCLAARAEEPLVGMWQMISQKVGDNNTRPLPIAIKISQPSATTLTFIYVSGREQKVNMTFTAGLDGKWVPVKNITGSPIGMAKLTKSGSKYTLVLQATGRAEQPGTLVLSEKNQILTCDTGPEAGKDRIVQVFARTQE